MSEPLFVYGTLRDPELLAAVLGRRATGVPAAAPGYLTVHYPGRVYPALVWRAGAAAEGLVLLDLTPFERDLLDVYEGAEYRRALIAVMIDRELHQVDAYLPAVAVALDSAHWSLPDWQKTHKARVLPAERASADLLRAKLVASRPH